MFVDLNVRSPANRLFLLISADHNSNSNDSDCSRNSLSFSSFNGIPSPKGQPTPPPSVPSALPSPSCSHQLHQCLASIAGSGGSSTVGGSQLIASQSQNHNPHNHAHQHSYDLRRKISSHFQYHDGGMANQAGGCTIASSSSSGSIGCAHANNASCPLGAAVPRKKPKRSCSMCNSPNEGKLLFKPP